MVTVADVPHRIADCIEFRIARTALVVGVCWEKVLMPERITQSVGIVAIVMIAAATVWEWRTANKGRIHTSRSGSTVQTPPAGPSTRKGRPDERNVFEEVCREEFTPRLAVRSSPTAAPAASGVRVIVPPSSLSPPPFHPAKLQARRTTPSACEALLGR